MKNLKSYYYSMVFCFLFCLFFIFLLRLIRVFTNKTQYLDLKIIIKFVLSFIHLYGLVTFLVLIFIIIIFRKFFIMVTKFNFLRVFYIHRNLFVPHVYEIRELTKKFLNKTPRTLNVLVVFLFRNLFKILVLLFFIYAIMFNNGVMYIKFLPWYGLYYFILSVIDNLFKLDWEFDLVTSSLYKGVSFTNDCFFKLKEYHTSLIVGNSEYIFINSIDLVLKKPLGNIITIKKDVDYFLILQNEHS